MRGVWKLSISGARLRPKLWTYSEVEKRKKGDVSLKALTRDILRASAPIVADSMACNLIFQVVVVIALEA